MTKQELFNLMKGRISMSSIREYSGEYVLFGKFGIVSFMGDYWDIWVTGVHRGKDLSQRKVNSLSRRISASATCEFQELTGESEARVPDSEGAYIAAVLLGVRRKRKASVKQLEALRNARLKRAA
jgi:hypothetical protein